MDEKRHPEEVDVSRFTDDWGEHIVVIENENLQCINCKYLIAKEVASCKKYKVKPNAVLDGKPVCTCFEAK